LPTVRLGLRGKLDGGGADLYAQVREGLLDIVTTHLGVADLPAFVEDRVGRFPHVVFATVLAYIAAPADPAGILAASFTPPRANGQRWG
jgi:hypothetical protein